MYSPGVVRETWRPLRSNSGRPICASRSLTCIVTAGGVRLRVRAALAKLSWRATSVNTRNWRNVAFFIQLFLNGRPRKNEFILFEGRLTVRPSRTQGAHDGRRPDHRREEALQRRRPEVPADGLLDARLRAQGHGHP